ncbi:neuroendocrine convertase 2-like isoform X1 [Physella acuta]|uniref:neuroendocrine convertase 2-like isoform X1 n=1 Tax=Physella acuta TaxID=109671 RepID=UPI0027DD2AFC|nr:neuroendocrine convertase 2-like isoform X1 [Physella acuta]
MSYFLPGWPRKVLLCLLCWAICGPSLAKEFDVSTNHWLVELTHDAGPEVARRVARDTGFTYVGPVLGSASEFHFIHHGVPHARTKRSIPHTRQLRVHPKVRSAFQQSGYVRVKRGYKDAEKVLTTNKQHISLKAKPQLPNDPDFDKQWYLRNTGQSGGVKGLDLNVMAAWAMGYSGAGVTTAIMDDGIDYLHEDLKYNYDADASYDFSSNDPYPYPRYTDTWFNSHGTRCAGEVSAAKDNGVCGVGVAYGSKVAGLRMLDQPFMTDLIEANAMGHMPNVIDIYSASWGPTDDGKTVDGPRNLTMRAIVNGVNNGRNGLGNVYVWASGDGGPNDDCNCDGYAASMWTISINSATNDGQTAGYDESCSSTLASTFSNGKSNARDAPLSATTDLYNNCTASHSGTSAAAPEAAGVFALALEANRNLTWRDMQHLTVLTSKRNSLYDSNGIHHWKLNGAHLLFNHLFGYGVLDAASMVDLASQWRGLPERFHCKAGSVSAEKPFSFGKPLRMSIESDGCFGTENEVNYLEHVQAFITLRSTYRGCVTMYLTSPMGTTSMILSQRPNDDDDKNGFTRWPFMTTHTWAELSRGAWTLDIVMEPIMGVKTNIETGFFKEWTLVLHGTKTAPYANQPADKERHEKLYLVRRAHESGVIQE